MLFNSIEFLIFLPIVFALYFLLPKKIRHIELLIASYVFYAWWDWKLLFLIIGTTLVSYFAAILIKKTSKIGLRRLVLILGIVICLGCLFFFKYANMIANTAISVANWFGGGLNFIDLNIILPVGISFYTFQTLSYIIDVYNNKIEPEKNVLFYALYVSFFPQLVAGPIERSETLLPQLKNQDGIKSENITQGLKLMLIGFVKKIAIADMLGVYANNIFNDIYNANGLLIVIGTLLFSIQILCDFSGYSDIAKGTAKLFNVDLMQNFDHPYRSGSIKEFWNRWHISLSTWLRDYIYFPMGGSRVNKFKWVINILVVFLVSGLWHGAAYTFVLWGLLHGIYRVVGELTGKFRNKAYEKLHINIESKPVKIFRIVITYLLVCFAWIAFRSNSFDEMIFAYKTIFTSWNFNADYFASFSSFIPQNPVIFIIIGVGIALFLVVDKCNFKPSNKTSISVLHTCAYIALIWVTMFAFIYLNSANVESSFIYFQF